MNTNEIFYDIPNYEGYYQINKNGIVKSLDREIFNGKGKYIRKGRIISTHFTHGYKKCNLHINNICKHYSIHKLLAETFIKNPNNLETVNHINGIKTDNRLENLEWMSRIDNSKHAHKIGLYSSIYKITPEIINKVVILYQNGYICPEICKEVSLGITTIYRILKNNMNLTEYRKIAKHNSRKRKLTKEQIEEIQELYKTGKFKQIDLVKKFNLNRSSMNRILKPIKLNL